MIYGSERRRVSDYEDIHQNVLQRNWYGNNKVVQGQGYGQGFNNDLNSSCTSSPHENSNTYNTYGSSDNIYSKPYPQNIPQTNQVNSLYNTVPAMPSNPNNSIHTPNYDMNNNIYNPVHSNNQMYNTSNYPNYGTSNNPGTNQNYSRNNNPIQPPSDNQIHPPSPQVNTPSDNQIHTAHHTTVHDNSTHSHVEDNEDDESGNVVHFQPSHWSPKEHEPKEHTIIANIHATITPPPATTTKTPPLPDSTKTKRNVMFDPVPGLFPKVLVDRILKEREVEVIVHGPKKETKVFSVQ